MGNRASGTMANSEDTSIDKALGIVGGVIFLVIGIIAFLTDLSRIGAVILIILGIGGFILAFKKSRNEDRPI